MKKPEHLAIIMDGNGRWAHARGRSRAYGHIRGARVAKKIIATSIDQGIKNLTLFAFSTENWFRPSSEVNFLMRLLAHRIRREHQVLIEKNVRFRIIGDVSRLPDAVRTVAQQTVNATRNNTGMNLIFALSYGGRQDVVSCTQKLAQAVQAGDLAPEQIDEFLISSYLQTDQLPDPDLIIRTSGEQRLSNFFLWQAAYSEICFSQKPWPDYSVTDYLAAIQDFACRQRRFGRIDGNLKEPPFNYYESRRVTSSDAT